MDYKSRIQKLQSKIAGEAYEALLIEEPIDILYLTGMNVSRGSLIISSDDSHFILDARYFEMGARVSPVNVVLEKNQALENLLKSINKLGFCARNTSYKRFEELKELCEPISSHNLVEELRQIKDSDEVEHLKEAAKLGSRGFDFVLSILKEGTTEKKVARELEMFWLQEGGEGLAFDSIIAFGVSSSMPHYHPQDIPLKKGDPVLIDIGVKLNHYHSDMTRVIFFEGKPSEKMAEIYEIVKVAQAKAVDACKAGITAGELDEVARTYITKKGYGKQFSHGLGHGVGLEIHEGPVLSSKPPHSDFKLEAGMVVTIEPGIYLPDIGGVRIEDTVIVTESGCIDFTQREKY